MQDNFDKWLKNMWSNTGKTKLESIRKILYALEFEKKFKIINIVGTNGKGSVAKYLTDNLIRNGYKVGTFTSPHLLSFNERITVNNYKITNNQFYNIIHPIEETLDKHNIMWFARLYIAALMHFMQKEVDFVILEAGIGGELDPTNTVPGDFGAVTSISEDHLDIFGSRDKIAPDKAGIINDKMMFFMPSSLSAEDQDAFYKRKEEKSFTLIKVKVDPESTYQEKNETLAQEMLEFILDKDEDFVFKLPKGRSEILTKNIIVDVAHNQDGFDNSCHYYKKYNFDFDQIVLSLSDNKDIKFEMPKKLFLYKNKGPKPMEVKDYPMQGTEIKNLRKFILDNKDIKTLYIGSFYLVSEVMEIVNEEKQKSTL